MESYANPVAKRTRNQINKRIDQLIEELNKKKQQEKQLAQKCADSVNSERGQESRERQDKDCNEDGDHRSQLDPEEDKRDEEPRKIASFDVPSSSSSEEDTDMSPSSSEEYTTDDSDYILHKEDKSMTWVRQSLDTRSDGSSYSSDDDDDEEVVDHGDRKRRKTDYKQGQKDGCSVSKSEKMGLGCSIADPVEVGSESEDSGASSSEQSSSSDNDESLNHDYKQSLLPSKRGRKKQKLPENSNHSSAIKQKKPESKKSNGPHCVDSDSDSSLGVSDEKDNVAVTKKRGRKRKLPEISNPGSVSKQKKPEFEKSNDLNCVHELNDSDSSLIEGDKKDNGAVTKKRGRKPKLSETSTPCSVSTHKKHGSEKANGAEPVFEGEKIKRHYSKYSKSKAQGSRKSREFISILSETILGNGVENMLPREETSPVESSVESSLPLKFGFAYEYPVPVEKTEEEKEIEALFACLEMGLMENEIGATNAQMEDDDSVNVTMMTPAERCLLGYHVIILSESIGKICKYCKTVCEEIHDVLPDLVMRTRVRGESYTFRKKNRSIFDRLEFDESGRENHCTITNLTGSVLNLIPADLRRSMYLHQRDGYEFLWKNVGGASLIEKLKTPLQNGGTGCIISHAPGTGKSFLTIVFLQAFLKVYPNCKPMIVAPQSMLLTWEAEFEHWGVNIPFVNLNDGDLSVEEKKMATRLSVDLRTLSSRERTAAIRMIKLHSWIKDRGILGISYQLFEKLGNDPKDADHKFRKILLEKPGLVILDEGHTPRNERSRLWKILTKLETRRRIILSGTPFQNNCDELRNILSLVKPGFDRHGVDNHSWRGGKGRKGKGGAWDSLTKSIDKNSVNGTDIDPAAMEKLKSMVSPIVHVHKGCILQQHLPGLKDTLIFLKPTHEQKRLLKEIEALPKKVLKYLKRSCIESLISTHPSVAANEVLFHNDRDWLKKLEHIHDAGVKTKVLIEIIRLSIARSEKVLVFSSYLEPLKFIMNLLMSYFTWAEGQQVLLMEGKVDMRDRQSMINRFNNPKDDSKVLLASTYACSEGINLVGASRVVLLDVVWNPSRERQAICRAYRLGQTKVVHVYRLIMSETKEMRKFRKQTKKDHLSEMVFSSKEVDSRKHQEVPSRVSDDMVLDAIVQHPNLRDSFEYILNQPKQATTILRNEHFF